MMKKQGLRKIIASLSLSLCLALSAGVALNGINNDYAKASTTVTGQAYASTVVSDGGTATFVKNEKQVSSDATFTGVKLKAVSGVTYELGAVDIANSDWAGTATASASGNNNSLFEFVLAPDVAGDVGTGDVKFTVNFTQGDKTMSVQVATYREGTGATQVVNYFTKANGQNYGAYRQEKGWVAASSGNWVLKQRVLKKDLNNVGVNADTDLEVKSNGTSTTTNAWFYDFNDNALYTHVTFLSSTGLGKSYLIRDFDANDATNGNEAVWSGFAKKDGKCVVNVSVSFDVVLKNTNVLVTKLGDVAIDETVDVTGDKLLLPLSAASQVNVGEPTQILMPATLGARSVEMVYQGETVATYAEADIVDNKISFTPNKAGAYDIIYKVSDYYTNVVTVKAVGAGFSVDKTA